MKKFKIIIILIFALVTLAIYFKRGHNQPPPTPPASRQEIDITIIEGWNLRQIATDWEKRGLIKNENELYAILGQPAYNYLANKKVAPRLNYLDNNGQDSFALLKDKSSGVSYEGYIFPDTYRVYADAKLSEVLQKIFTNLENKITTEMRAEIKRQGKTVYEVLTMASVVEKEANTLTDMQMVADIFWRREKQDWALQSCATVNYITGKNDPAVSAEDQQVDSLYNTYKYPGLPLGPIGNPGLNAIKAVIYPKTNNYWYFMTGADGKMYYASTLEEHNSNVYKYLR